MVSLTRPSSHEESAFQGFGLQVLLSRLTFLGVPDFVALDLSAFERP